MQRFIVGTGRCGSTLLDRMIAENDSVLVLSEFFSAIDRVRALAAGEMTGAEFAAVLLQPNPYVELMMRRQQPSGTPLSHPAGRSEWAHNGGVPGPLLVTFPVITDQPDELFADVIAEISSWPRQTLGVHLRTLFDRLADRLGKQCWLERSGVSLDYLGRLIDLFPDSHFVHIHREGSESALSMRDHPFFTLFTSYMFKPPTELEIEQSFAATKPPDHDPVLRRLRDRPPIGRFGDYWTYQVVMGMREMRRLPTDRYLEVRYEDLRADAPSLLARIAEFLELPESPGWIERASRLLSDSPLRFGELRSSEQDELRVACLPGQILLGQLVPEGLDPLWTTMREHLIRSTPV